MSNSDSDNDEEAAAMALAMGFTSFGAAPAQKKRKYNNSTDAFAFVDGQEQDLEREGKKGKGIGMGSGGNNVKLGRARVLGTGAGGGGAGIAKPLVLHGNADAHAHAGNEAEINLHAGADGEGDGSDDEERPNYVDTSLPAPVEGFTGTGSGHEGDGIRKLQSQAPEINAERETEADEMQAKIDEILASAQPGVSVAPLPTSGYTDTGIVERGLASASASLAVESGRGGGGVRGGRGGFSSARGGRRNERWWEGYYDASFNVNPWEALEKKAGLRTVGRWLEKGHWDLKAGVRVPTAGVSSA